MWLDQVFAVAMKVLLVGWLRLLLILAGICFIHFIGLVALYMNRDYTIESFGHGSPRIVPDLELSVNNLCKWTL